MMTDTAVSETVAKASNTVISASGLTARLISYEIRTALKQSGPLARLFMAIGGKRAAESAMPYISAMILLLFEMKGITKESLGSLVRSAGLTEDKRIESFVYSLKVNDPLPYVSSAYFLKDLGRAVSTENVSAVVSALGATPNIQYAGFVLGKYAEEESGKRDAAQGADGLEERIESSLSAAAKLTSNLIILELKRTFEREDVRAKELSVIMPYLDSAALLSSIGADLGQTDGPAFREKIRRILRSIGVVPQEDLLDFLLSINYGNALIYVPPLFFLVSLNVTPTVERIGKVAVSLGKPRDDVQAGYVLTSYNYLVGMQSRQG